MSWNKVYEQLVDSNNAADANGPGIRGYIAYCLYKEAKREWIKKISATKGRRPSEQEINDFSETYVNSTLDALRSKAEAILADYSKAVVEKEKQGIIAQALKGSIGRDIFIGCLVNFIWALVLIAFVLIIQKAGVDIIDMLDIRPPQSAL